MKAVHLGAGNIGRGFVGLLLHEAGCEVVFSDVAEALVQQLQEADSFTVTTIGQHPTTTVVDGFRALNSAQDPETLTEEIASADIVTTAVGARILRFVAPNIAAGIAARPAELPHWPSWPARTLINATDLLEQEIRANYQGDDLEERALFANTAVDRIVPVQAEGAGLDVTVEDFFEWAVEREPFGGTEPDIPGITWVDDLEPYIERKLFTVNTGHATTAWHGWAADHATIAEAIRDPAIKAQVETVLAETSALLIAQHGFSEEDMAAYRHKVLGRFANTALPDPVQRVGRAPLRKLSREDRIVGPTAALAERGMGHEGLLSAFAAALAFTPEGDEEVDRLQELLRTADADAATLEITGLTPDHPLHPEVRALIAARLADA